VTGANFLRWPAPGSAPAEPETYDLPDPRFRVGQRVRTRWGNGTICGVYHWPLSDGDRAYNVHHDGSSAPPEFGHIFSERGIELLGDDPVVRADEDEGEAGIPASGPQMEMFA